jgi:hypothetical protein
MAKLEWDKLTDRTFEAGLDRGVLYPIESPGVPWNGLVSVNEKLGRELKSYYLDGIKFLDHFVPGAYSASLSAFTYPEELDRILGVHEFVPGVRIHDQRVGMFHLSYRTLIGDPLDGLDLGYKLHLVYNLTANPSDVAFNSLGKDVAASVFQWEISGVQTSMWGIRPANHLSFDSRDTPPEILTMVENALYGTETTEPGMPDLVELLTTIEGMAPA